MLQVLTSPKERDPSNIQRRDEFALIAEMMEDAMHTVFFKMNNKEQVCFQMSNHLSDISLLPSRHVLSFVSRFYSQYITLIKP